MSRDTRQIVNDIGVTYECSHQRTPATPNDAALLDNEELLASLLGRTERNRVALAHSPKNLRDLSRLHPRDLEELGFSPAPLRKLRAFFELARRFGETEWEPGAAFRSSYDVYAHFRERLADARQEIFLAVLLDNKHRKLSDLVVSVGSLTSSIVHPRDVYARVIREPAAAVIFVHNHPSGDPTPSREDLEITRRLREVGDLVGVRVLDHLVIGHGRYVSFVDDGYW